MNIVALMHICEKMLHKCSKLISEEWDFFFGTEEVILCISLSRNFTNFALRNCSLAFFASSWLRDQTSNSYFANLQASARHKTGCSLGPLIFRGSLRLSWVKTIVLQYLGALFFWPWITWILTMSSSFWYIWGPHIQNQPWAAHHNINSALGFPTLHALNSRGKPIKIIKYIIYWTK